MPDRPRPAKRARALLLSAFALAAAPGCHRRLTVDEHRAVAAVKEYNTQLPRAYLVQKPELVTVATDSERERLGTLVSGLGQRGLVLDSRQENLELGRVEVFNPPTIADVETVETWWYRHVEPRGGSEAQAPRRVRYTLRYRLVQRRSQWLVDHLELLKSEDLPPAG